MSAFYKGTERIHCTKTYKIEKTVNDKTVCLKCLIKENNYSAEISHYQIIIVHTLY